MRRRTKKYLNVDDRRAPDASRYHEHPCPVCDAIVSGTGTSLCAECAEKNHVDDRNTVDLTRRKENP